MAHAGFSERDLPEPLSRLLAEAPSRRVRIFWLGQAGFVVEGGGKRLIIDPYLSDALARKYHGTALPHDRLVPPPVSPADLGQVDLVLCTHQHTDHLDGETLRPLAARLPQLRFVVPAAAADLAMERIGIGVDRLILADAGWSFLALPGVEVHGFRAAHETLEYDAAGHCRFLGYGIDIAGCRIFHSGDTIPFEGQAAEIAAYAPHVALLPVNGRSATLQAAGIAGNLTLAEAARLTVAARIPAMVAHHYGMFAFNTADPQAIDAAAAEAPFNMIRARFDRMVESDNMTGHDDL